MGAEGRLLPESLVMRYQMRVGHRRFPSIGGRVRVDRSIGRRVLRDRQAVSERTKETSGDQYGGEECDHAKRIHKRFLESRSMSRAGQSTQGTRHAYFRPGCPVFQMKSAWGRAGRRLRGAHCGRSLFHR